MIKSLPEAKISPHEFSTVLLSSFSAVAYHQKSFGRDANCYPLACGRLVRACRERVIWLLLCWVDLRSVGSGHEGSGVLAEHGGESGQGAAPAGGAVLAFQPADGSHAYPGPVGQRFLGHAVLAA
jgi:hypothetical protein